MSSNDTNDTNGTLHTPSSTGNLDLFDIDNVQIVNIHTATGFPLCDAYIGREWKESYGPTPLVGSDVVIHTLLRSTAERNVYAYTKGILRVLIRRNTGREPGANFQGAISGAATVLRKHVMAKY